MLSRTSLTRTYSAGHVVARLPCFTIHLSEYPTSSSEASEIAQLHSHVAAARARKQQTETLRKRLSLTQRRRRAFLVYVYFYYTLALLLPIILTLPVIRQDEN